MFTAPQWLAAVSTLPIELSWDDAIGMIDRPLLLVRARISEVQIKSIVVFLGLGFIW